MHYNAAIIFFLEVKLNRTLFTKLALSSALAVLLLSVLSLTACKKEIPPTATPTKTPTEVPPLATATPTPVPTSTRPPPTLTPTATPTAKTADVVATPTEEPTATPTSRSGPDLIEMGDDVNPLTGLKTDPARLNRRPLAIKVPNAPIAARPQSGLSVADVVIEHEAEAYLTRFTAIYLGQDASLVGPVRSLRIPDSEVVPIFKAAIVASGGHPAVKIRMTEGKLWAEGYQRIICPEDPFLGDGGTLQRMPDKKPVYELTLYTDTSNLWSLLDQRGINERQDFSDMFVFSEDPPAGGSEATNVKVLYKPEFNEVEYQYDAETKTYKRFDVGEPLVDELTGAQIAPANVVLLYVNHVDTDIAADTHDPNHTWYAVSIQLWGTGPAQVIRDGQVFDATWVRENPQQETDRLLFRDSEGNQIPFRPGPTWIQLIRLGSEATIE
jgi:hypothetical protein